MVKLLGDATPANLAGRLGPTLVPTTAARAKKVRVCVQVQVRVELGLGLGRPTHGGPFVLL